MQGYCKWRPLQHSFAYEIESGNKHRGALSEADKFRYKVVALGWATWRCRCVSARAGRAGSEGSEESEGVKLRRVWVVAEPWQPRLSMAVQRQFKPDSHSWDLDKSCNFWRRQELGEVSRYIPVALHRGHYLALRFQGCNVALTASLCGGGWSDGQTAHTHTHTPEKADQKIDAEELLKTCSRRSSCTSRKRARSSGAPALLKTCSSIGHADQEELLRSCSSVKRTKKEIVEEAQKAEKTKCKKKSLVPKTSPSSQPGVSSEIQEPHEMEAGDIQKPLTAQWADLVWFIWMFTVYGLEKARVNASGQSLPEVGPVNVPQAGPDFNFRYLVDYGLEWIKRFGRTSRIADGF